MVGCDYVECSVLCAAAVREDKDVGEAELHLVVVDNLGERLVMEMRATLCLREDSPYVSRYRSLTGQLVLNW